MESLQTMKLKIFSTDVTISYMLICLFAVSIITGVAQGFIFCFLSVIIHEIGHLIPMCKFGYYPEKIRISLFEISICDNCRQKRSNKQNFLIILFGPIANLICFILFFLLYLLGNNIFMVFAFTNLSACLFNLLPVMSLDGGQLMYLLLCKHLNDRASERIVDVTTFIILFPLSAIGFLILFNSKYNFSLLFVCIYLVLSLVCRNNRYY